jgi:uncharacterized protein YcfJ
MTISHPSNRIHPLVAMAAVSVTLVSALGIAAITGVLPTSRGSTADSPRAPTELASETKQFVLTGSADSAKQKPSQHSANAQPHAVSATTPQSVGQVNSTGTTPPPQSTKAAPQNSPVGIGVGAVIGGVLGNQIGSGDGKTLATIAGAISGGYIGNEVAKKNQ